jgi:hypothetical protein
MRPAVLLAVPFTLPFECIQISEFCKICYSTTISVVNSNTVAIVTAY